MSRQVWRNTIPVDDRSHVVAIFGPIVHVASREPQSVEVWHEHTEGGSARLARLRVFGTGQPLPDKAVHVGTALTSGPLVWHLYEMADPA